MGDVLNCNCHEVASSTAVALQADKLIILHDWKGRQYGQYARTAQAMIDTRLELTAKALL